MHNDQRNKTYPYSIIVFVNSFCKYGERLTIPNLYQEEEMIGYLSKN